MADLSRLLNPRTIAVIGGKEAERVIEQCDKLGFSGTIWPVHPKKTSVRGYPCFASLDDLPEAPDAAYIAVNRERSIDVVAQLNEMGAGGAVCYAAGFAEADGENEGSGDLQRRLIKAAGDMPIIGPNCYGFINAVEKVALWPDQHGAIACESGVAILTQSSNIAINMTMQKRGLPIAYVMTVGNQAQQGLSAIGESVLEDERVTALGLHIEGLDDVQAFESLALRARELGKPIVAIKVGKSEQAQAAAMTHTASLAGSDVAHDALFTRLGIARVHSIEVFLETLKLLHVHGPLQGSDLLSLSCSGGEASLMADAAQGRSVQYRPFAPNEASALKAELGEIVTVANPLDYNTFIWGNWPAMTRMFEAALAPNFDLALLVMDFPRDDRCDPFDWKAATDTFIAAAKQMRVKTAVVSSLPETMPEAVAENLIRVGIAPLCGLDTSVLAAEAASAIGRFWSQEPASPLLSVSRRNSETETLSELESKSALAAFGLTIPTSVSIDSSTDIAQASSGLSFPMALKALGISHKSEAGAVKLGLGSVVEIETARSDLADIATTFLLEEMAEKPVAELIVGTTRDPVVGLLMTIGAGGVLTEILEDTASLLLPTTEADIAAAMQTLKINTILQGFRGAEHADTDALLAAIKSIADYATANAHTLEELDVNPLFALTNSAVAVDALIVKRKSP